MIHTIHYRHLLFYIMGHVVHILFLLHNTNGLSIHNRFAFTNSMSCILNLVVFLIPNICIFRFQECSLYNSLCMLHNYRVIYRNHRLKRKLLGWIPICLSILNIFDYPNPKLYILYQLVVFVLIKHNLHPLFHNLYSMSNIYHQGYPMFDSDHWLDNIFLHRNKLCMNIFHKLHLSKLRKVDQQRALNLLDLLRIFHRQQYILDNMIHKLQ